MGIPIPKSISGPVGINEGLDRYEIWDRAAHIIPGLSAPQVIAQTYDKGMAEFIAACLNKVIDDANKPLMTPVVGSSNIKEIGYHKDRKELWVTFSSKGNETLESTYVYSEVPEQTNVDMMASDSKGKFVHASIKGKFKFRKVA